jgi:lipopolysaccharide transport system ATP-binding protein
MSQPAIKVENVSKKYVIGHLDQDQFPTLRDSLANATRRFCTMLRHPLLSTSTALAGAPNTEDFWALREISFDVAPGERLGVIGRNGAGKSTLLKILSRITEPTTGKIRIKGRVASLLEVGTGFHPELTGRENIFLNGAILGMSKAEINKKFDEIVDFAEIETFLDTPVKRYSSGMYVRLAFAVAAHLEPDILVVDEVLAVGDIDFQKKCLDKMKSIGNTEQTVVFVSHNLVALQALCDRAIWLSGGRIVDEGPAKKVVSGYLKEGSELNSSRLWPSPEDAPGNDKVRLRSVKVDYPHKGTAPLSVDSPVSLEFSCWYAGEDAAINFSLVLNNENDVCVFNAISEAVECKRGVLTGKCHIPGNFLNDSSYRARLLVVREGSVPLAEFVDVLVFEVVDSARDGRWFGKWEGVVRTNLAWTLDFQEARVG